MYREMREKINIVENRLWGCAFSLMKSAIFCSKREINGKLYISAESYVTVWWWERERLILCYKEIMRLCPLINSITPYITREINNIHYLSRLLYHSMISKMLHFQADNTGTRGKKITMAPSQNKVVVDLEILIPL